MHPKVCHGLQRKDRPLALAPRPPAGPPAQSQPRPSREGGRCPADGPRPVPAPDPPPRPKMCNPGGGGGGGGGGPGIHQGDGDGPLDIWAVVKPGNTREKIAFFAAHQGGGGRPGPLKSKSSWDLDGRAAKRRKKPPGPQRAKAQPERRRAPAPEPPGPPPGRPPSVAQMVAFLERRAGALLAAGPPRPGGPDAAGEEAPPPQPPPGEAVRVSAMVARLESEGLGRREPGPPARDEGSRRQVGRVLLAEGGPARPRAAGGGPPGPGAGDGAAARRDRRREDPVPGLLFFLRPGGPPPGPAAAAAAAERGRPAGREPPCPKRPVSHDFLEARFKIQQLLEPQQYLTFLPHHIMVKIFGLLPTRSLVALKVTCAYFKFLIEHYSVRPADSRWVRDPRYREDPCKQCKKTYVHGDVSLCRWHPKPYCQALPYGPGYWMCCHRAQKGVPGCQLGLHDNRWVPACHSLSRPAQRRARGAEEEG
ncbi:LOW QUALITY PROTEIN: F-box only protein 34 [Tachyglossus aculeatus]|uniref:LOW QUALITY PROTEIN: F-box only protein 34 n=1 Tax=Tachyglossus aculeatus TaxID=9261 RepID=UPI0018F365B6|nr:LOW QUALITY PROTEIN: F-box only protein 34 [Tachyglossus aculeatus]